MLPYTSCKPFLSRSKVILSGNLLSKWFHETCGRSFRPVGNTFWCPSQHTYLTSHELNRYGQRVFVEIDRDVCERVISNFVDGVLLLVKKKDLIVPLFHFCSLKPYIDSKNTKCKRFYEHLKDLLHISKIGKTQWI